MTEGSTFPKQIQVEREPLIFKCKCGEVVGLQALPLGMPGDWQTWVSCSSCSASYKVDIAVTEESAKA